MTSIPSASTSVRFGEPTVSRHTTCVCAGSRRPKWRAANARMPSMKPSSAPVDTSSTRRPSIGSRASWSATPTSAATPVALSLAPGTTSREPMSAKAAAEPSDTHVPARSSRRRPVSAPRATSAGPPNTVHISGGLVLLRSSSPGNHLAARSGMPG